MWLFFFFCFLYSSQQQEAALHWSSSRALVSSVEVVLVLVFTGRKETSFMGVLTCKTEQINYNICIFGGSEVIVQEVPRRPVRSGFARARVCVVSCLLMKEVEVGRGINEAFVWKKEKLYVLIFKKICCKTEDLKILNFFVEKFVFFLLKSHILSNFLSWFFKNIDFFT